MWWFNYLNFLMQCRGDGLFLVHISDALPWKKSSKIQVIFVWISNDFPAEASKIQTIQTWTAFDHLKSAMVWISDVSEILLCSRSIFYWSSSLALVYYQKVSDGSVVNLFSDFISIQVGRWVVQWVYKIWTFKNRTIGCDINCLKSGSKLCRPTS